MALRRIICLLVGPPRLCLVGTEVVNNSLFQLGIISRGCRRKNNGRAVGGPRVIRGSAESGELPAFNCLDEYFVVLRVIGEFFPVRRKTRADHIAGQATFAPIGIAKPEIAVRSF